MHAWALGPAAVPGSVDFDFCLDNYLRRGSGRIVLVRARRTDGTEIALIGSTPNSPLIPPGNVPAADAPPPNTVKGWKSEITARVRAHRSRGSRAPENQPTLPGLEDALPGSIAARVAERYSRLPSYREVMETRTAPAQPLAEVANSQFEPEAQADPAVQFPKQSREPTGEAVWHQQELLAYSVSSDSLPAPRVTPPEARAEFSAMQGAYFGGVSGTIEADPMGGALIEPTVPLPASLVSQPRELIAARKARPRLAEGPLRAEMEMPDAGTRAPNRAIAGLAESVANSPSGEAEAAPEADPTMPRHSPPVSAQWLSIDLDSEGSVPKARTVSTVNEAPALHVAPLEDRFFAELIDIALTMVAFLMFFTVFAISSTSLPHGRVALVTAAVTLFATWLIYQLLFFGFTDATPGMRYVKIALCTFDDENPSRKALRGRIAASLLSALPLGLGFLWAVFDDDSLGWHDRITQTYQRSYREN